MHNRKMIIGRLFRFFFFGWTILASRWSIRFSVSVASAFSTVSPNGGGARIQSISTRPFSPHLLRAYKPVVVVGKIIIDEYGDPFPDSRYDDESHKKKLLQDSSSSSSSSSNDDDAAQPPAPPKTVSIGGGGPQAAFGASAALAVWDRCFRNHNKEADTKEETKVPPVIFVAPVGKDWTHSETKALESSLGATASIAFHDNNDSIITHPDNGNTQSSHSIETHLVRGRYQSDESAISDDGFFTPRIRLWHDRDQICHWYALNDSFGPNGADGLWRRNPSANDLSSILGSRNHHPGEGVVLHAIAETWTGAAGGQLDFLPLLQDNEDLLKNHISFVGIEPVASGETVTKEDAKKAAVVLESCCKTISACDRALVDSVFWCPDRDLDQALRTHDLYGRDNTSTTTDDDDGLALLVATRDGPRGSEVWHGGPKNNPSMTVPAAALDTEDGAPIDPTGAGNAYSGAMTALLGNGVTLSVAACIASGIGAVVCEHEGLPPVCDWHKTLDRIASAARDVESKLLSDKKGK